MNNKKYILCLSCPDQPGIIATITSFIAKNQGNITSMRQFSSPTPNLMFYCRIEFECSQKITPETLTTQFADKSKALNASFKIIDSQTKLKAAILVSHSDHCLVEILYRIKSQDIHLDISCIISNHNTHQKIAAEYNIPFYYIPANKKDRKEKAILEKIKNTDFVILARYMQILSPSFLKQYGKDIINIHHSSLPSFKGGDPYQQAYDRGVKLIGATAHLVTEELDEGPIIEQDTFPIAHHHTVETMKSWGKHMEKKVLCMAIEFYTQHRIMRNKNKTIVFKT